MNADLLNNIIILSPLLAAAVTAFTVMFMDMAKKPNVALECWAAISGLIITGVTAVPLWSKVQAQSGNVLSLWNGIYVVDKLSLFFTVLACITAVLVLLFSLDYLKETKSYPGEFITLALFVTLGSITACSTKELLTFFVAFEIMSLPLYVMAAWGRFNKKSSEAGLKYFLMGAVSSAVMLYGISLVFGTTGSTFFDVIVSNYISCAGDVIPRQAFLMGALMIFASLCFKAAAVPFHMWAPDVYEGAPSPSGMFISTAPKAIMIAFMLRLYMSTFSLQGMDFRLADVWVVLFATIAIISMLWGNLTALVQTDIKRLMAYSGIAQIGYTLLGVMAASRFGATDNGAGSAIFYIAMYSFANLAAWSVILIYGWHNNTDKIEDYKGLAKRSPFLAFTLLISFLSLAGAPPLAGFVGKFYLFRAVWEAHTAWWWIVLIAIINSVISLYYYFNVLKPVYFDQPSEDKAIQVPLAVKLGLMSCIAVIAILGICPDIARLALQAGSIVTSVVH